MTTYITTASTSRLLLLPAEVRNYIFTLTLDNDMLLVRSRPLYRSDQAKLKPSLLQVNRQLRIECLPISYGINTFCIILEGSEERRQVISRLRHNSEVRAHVRTLRFWTRGHFTLNRKRTSDAWELRKWSWNTKLIENPCTWLKKTLTGQECEAWKEIFALLGCELPGL